MSTEVFANSYKETKTVTADGSVLTWSVGGHADSVPLLCSAININYARSVSPITPVNGTSGGATLLQVVGRPSGTLSIAGLVTTSNEAMLRFIQAVGRACINPKDSVTVTLHPYSDENCISDMTWILKGVICNSLGIAASSQNGVSIINKPMNFVFTRLEADPGTGVIQDVFSQNDGQAGA